jgi:Cu2+-containing amine oxidase
MSVNRSLRRSPRFSTFGVALLLSGAPGALPLLRAQDASIRALDHSHLLDVAPEKDSPTSHVPCEGQSISFAAGSTWELCVGALHKFGLVISHARFQKAPAASFVTLLYDARLGEIFVPYHPGSPRFHDIGWFQFLPLTLTPNHCPPPRVIIADGTICRETRESGLAWMDDDRVRRGRQVVYWAVLDADNYNYIMEWSFHDDGTVVARTGSTGPKLGGADDKTGHMHDFTWRLDIDLDGPEGDSCHVSDHFEDATTRESRAKDRSALIATEGSRQWAATRFNTLEISDSKLRNGNGNSTSYELVPLRTGTSRHSEAYTKADLWVTRFSREREEILAKDLDRYVADAQPTVERDNVIWYTGSAHHKDHMRDEDRQTVPVIWTGFELVPQNLFEGTPFY